MWHIIYRKLWTQRKELRIMLVMAGISLMMIFAFGDFNGSYKPTVLVADQDNSPLSQKYFEKLGSDKNHSYQLVDQSEGIDAVKNTKALALITVEAGFEKGLIAGEAPALSLMSVKEDADLMVLKPLAVNAYTDLMSWHQTSTELAQAASQQGADFQAVYEETYKKLEKVNIDKNAITMSTGPDLSKERRNEVLMHSLIGFLIFFVAYSSVFGAADLLVERKQNTWQRLLISPSSKLGMLTGQLTVSWVVGLIQLALVLFFGAYVFKVDFGGSVALMFIAGSLFCLAMSGFGILLSAFGKSMQQISALTSVMLTAFGMLGGCLWPLELVKNKLLIGLSYFIPHRYAVEALTGISQGKSLSDVSAPLFILLLMTVLFLTIGLVKLMKTEEQYQ